MPLFLQRFICSWSGTIDRWGCQAAVSNRAVGGSSRAVGGLNGHGADPNQAVGCPDAVVEDPNDAVGSPNRVVGLPNLPFGSSDHGREQPVQTKREYESRERIYDKGFLPKLTDCCVKMLHTDPISQGVAAAGNRQVETGMTGQDLLNFLKELTQSCCCISDLVIASHGGKRGVGGSAPGESGFISGFVWSQETGQRTAAVHLQNMVSQGDIHFCPNCKIAVHGCRVGAEFAEELARVSGCNVVHAQAGCSAVKGDPANPWHSDAPGFNQMSPDGTSQPIGGTYNPNTK